MKAKGPQLRVDTATGLTGLVVEAYGVTAASLGMAALAVERSAVRFRHTGAVPEKAATPRIMCAWHEHLPSVFAGLMPVRVPTMWMNHPAWYMRPVHLMLAWSGIDKLALGSSGTDGRAALAQLIEGVRAGCSTFLTPDGPYGPARAVRDGVLDLAIATGEPITALAFSYRRAFRLPTWDRKWIPWPSGEVVVRWAPPLVVTADTREQARAALGAAMNGDAT